MQEETFSIHSEVNKVKFTINSVHGFPDSTFYMGGYDAECSIEIVSQGFSAKGSIFISTAQFYEFYEELKKAYQSLKGSAKISAYENDFYTELTFGDFGHVSIQGCYSNYDGTELKFYFQTDQSFIGSTLNDLSKIVEKYGGNLGRK